MVGRPKKKQELKRLTKSAKLKKIRKAFTDNLCFQDLMDIDEWADKYRYLPKETSSEHGLWSTDRFPFLRRIMKCLSPSSVARMIVVKKAHQLGFTELAINWMLYCADHNPGPMVYCQKTEDAVKRFSNQKLKPGILACDKVFDSLGEGKPKSLSNSVGNKAYPGGFISLGPANSAEFLKSVSARDGCTDEEDSYELSAGSDGAPWKMLEKRMSNFPDRKLYRPSTPKWKETSTIEPGFEAGSQERYYVPCPHCNPVGTDDGFMFVINWDTIRWSKEIDKQTGYPQETWCECPGCLGKINEARYKTWMLAKGDWYSEKNSPGTIYKVGDVVNPSFHISSLYSPMGFFSWSDAVIDWFDYLVKKDVNLLQVFINQVLGETFELSGQEISYNLLMNRREYYGTQYRNFDVATGGLCITAGVDIQMDRIEVETVAWGLHDECWGVDYAVLMGDTSQMGNRYGMLKDGQPSVWLLLDQYLARRWKHQSGAEMIIECTMIDSKYRTKEVNVFCRLRESRRIFPIQGKEGWGRALVACKKRRHENYRTLNYIAAVDQLKDKVRSQLLVDEPGPGFCHFPIKDCYSEKYFKGLTCESRDVKVVNGKKKLFWRNPGGARNEPTDLRNYAYSALIAYPVDMQARSLAENPTVAVQRLPARKRRMKPRGSAGIS